MSKDDVSVLGKRKIKEISPDKKVPNMIYYMPSVVVQREVGEMYGRVPVDLEMPGVRQFHVRSQKDVDAAQEEISKDFESEEVGSCKLIIDAHGIGTTESEDGDIGLPGNVDMFGHAGEFHPSEIFSNVTTNDKVFVIDIFGCNVGEEMSAADEDGVQTYLADLMDSEELSNAVIIINAGKSKIFADHAFKCIEKTFAETDPVRLFLLKILTYPETKSYVALSSESLETVFFKSSAPRPTSAADLSDEKLREFLSNEMRRFLEFCTAEMEFPNFDKLLAEMETKITPELLAEYRNDALRVEIARGKIKYVRHYIDYMRERGQDLNQVFGAEYASGYTLPEDVKVRDYPTLEVLLRAGCSVERCERVMHRSHLLEALRDKKGEVNLELVELLMKAGSNPDFEVKMKAGGSITPRILAAGKPEILAIFDRYKKADVPAASVVVAGGSAVAASDKSLGRV